MIVKLKINVILIIAVLLVMVVVATQLNNNSGIPHHETLFVDEIISEGGVTIPGSLTSGACIFSPINQECPKELGFDDWDKWSKHSFSDLEDRTIRFNTSEIDVLGGTSTLDFRNTMVDRHAAGASAAKRASPSNWPPYVVVKLCCKE